MVTKRSSFFNSARRYFSQGQIWQRYCLLKQYAIKKARRHACAIVPSQALIPHRTRQTPVARREAVSASLPQTSLPQAFSKASPYDQKSQWWNEIANAVTVYLCKDMVPCQNVNRKVFKEMVKTLPGTRYLPEHTRSAGKGRKKSILLNISGFFSCSFTA